MDVVGVGDKKGIYYVLDRDTLQLRWSKQLSIGGVHGGVQSTAAFADGVIYVAAHEPVDCAAFGLPEPCTIEQIAAILGPW